MTLSDEMVESLARSILEKKYKKKKSEKAAKVSMKLDLIITKIQKKWKKKNKKKSDNIPTEDEIREFLKRSSIFEIKSNKIIFFHNKNDDKKKETKNPEKPTKSSSIQDWRSEKQITLLNEQGQLQHDKAEFHPWTSFDDCFSAKETKLESSLVRHCTNHHSFSSPSPIQAQCWPLLCQGHDIIGIAETGSGKTLAFALPALTAMHRNNNKSKSNHIRLLVLSPTRELAMQSHQVLQDFGSLLQMKSIVLYGGVSKQTQISQLNKSNNINSIVATPGRLLDLLNDQYIDLSHVQYLILDEADRMMDVGFEQDVRTIISHCGNNKQQRQTTMFSATWPTSIQKVAAEFMTNPFRVYVGMEAPSNNNNNAKDLSPEEAALLDMKQQLSSNHRVEQIIQVIDDYAREGRLIQILRQHSSEKEKILIFGLYKKEVERLEYNLLHRHGFHNVTSIHGNKNQTSRTQALEQFKTGESNLLVATDVAARGLDIPNVSLVINYTFPLTISDYIHRIGRTGRAGRFGKSITFFQPSADKAHAGELQQVLRQANQPIPDELAQFGNTIKKKQHALYGNFGPNNGVPMKKATKITFNY